MTGFDLDARRGRPPRARTARRAAAYDSLIVAAGAGQSYFGHDEFSRWAPGMKTIDDALELRGRIFGAFEMAETETDPRRRRAWLTFVVVGAGPTGVEIAGQIAELSRARPEEGSSAGSIRAMRGCCCSTAARRSWPTSASGSRSGPRTNCERLGVEISCERWVTDLDGFGVDVTGPDGRSSAIAARTKVWAAGVPGLAAGRACWPRHRARRATGPGASRYCPTARCPAIRRSSPSAT